jgi:predicted Zn-dependent protease
MKPAVFSLGGLFRRLLLLGAVGLLVLYLLGATAGYVWLHFVRHNARITFADVAFFRVAAVRRDMAVEQFAAARRELAEKNIQAAFLNYSTAVRNDPDNIPGRLEAVDFLLKVNAGNLAVGMLEDGLARTPDDPRLITRTFEFFTTTGRDARVLDLLHGQLTSHFNGPNGPLLQTYEVLATLNLSGAGAAKKLLDGYPALANFPAAVPVVARVWWESKDRLKAIGLLESYLVSGAGNYPLYAELAGWQQASGLSAEAIRTAERAGAQFPAELEPRVLLIETLEASADLRAAAQAIESYLRDFSNRPEALLLLADSAGRHGQMDLAFALYVTGASRQADLLPLALYFADALARASRFEECRQVLAQLEAQTPENNTAFMVQLRQRQVIMAAALNDPDNVHEYARRLAAALRSSPDALESARRNFQKMGITGAVTELSGRAPAAAAAK